MTVYIVALLVHICGIYILCVYYYYFKLSIVFCTESDRM